MMKVTRGVLGAVTVINKIGVEHIPFLLEKGITGSKLWVLYKDLCGQNATNTINLLKTLKKNEEHSIYIERKQKNMKVFEYLSKY